MGADPGAAVGVELGDGARVAVAFARVVRGVGIDVPVGSVVTLARALAAVGVAERNGVYWAARATLVHRPEDRSRFDAAFDAFWHRHVDVIGAVPIPPEPVALQVDDADAAEPPLPSDDDEARVRTLTVRWSPTEVLRHKDFAAYSPSELYEARRLMADLRLAGALRRSRRLRPVPAGRGRPDLRGTVRATLRAGGEPVRHRRRGPALRSRRVVLLLDVSGSMEPYARALLRFVHAAVVGRARVEAFTLGTRLTRLTRELSTRDPDAALAAAGGAVADWSGGTRLGEALRAFNDRWGVGGMARGAVVVILSDGWDRGSPDALAEQLVRLGRVAHRIVWVNPLKATPGYAPLAAGMAAALPHVDEFVEGHSLASLERLVEVIAG